ncbi:MAG TPA: penicillin-binding protein 2 [Actinocrinis sp.]
MSHPYRFAGRGVSHTARSRIGIVQVLVLALLLTLGGRLWFLQVRSGAEFQQAAAANDLRTVVTPAVRGQILDDQGRPMVQNATVLDVDADLTTLQAQRDGGTAVLGRLAGALGVPAAQLEQRARLCSPTVAQPCWTGSPYQPVPVVQNVPTATALKIMEDGEQYPGVEVQPAAQLSYPQPYGMQAPQILGYLSPVTSAELDAAGSAFQPSDVVGRAGLEQTYDKVLRGANGVSEVAVDNLGRPMRTVSTTDPVSGDDVVTTLDARVQAAAEQTLAAAVQNADKTWDPDSHQNLKADSGAVVVVNVNTGGIVAMASYPSYSPTVWGGGGIDPAEYAYLTSPAAGTPLLDRAFQGEYAPGSTFKLVTATAMLQDGFSANATYDCSPSFNIGSQVFHNFEGEAYGPISLKQTIEVSCDTVFYRAAYQMWQATGGIDSHPATRAPEPIEQMALDYGFGAPSGIDLPGESAGLVQDEQEKYALWNQDKATWCSQAGTGFPDVAKGDPDRATYLQQIAKENCSDGWRFRPGDALLEAIGQGGIEVTPLQLARAYAALANGGTIYQPHLEQAVIAPDGKVVSTFQPKAVGHVPVSAATRSFLVGAFEGVAQVGTAAGVYGGWPQNQIPVGAKTGTADVYGRQANSVFASFVPANHPQYAVAMIVPQGGQGAYTSGPAVEKIEAALYGIQGGAVNPQAALLPQPPANLPVISSAGLLPGAVDAVAENAALVHPEPRPVAVRSAAKPSRFGLPLPLPPLPPRNPRPVPLVAEPDYGRPLFRGVIT